MKLPRPDRITDGDSGLGTGDSGGLTNRDSGLGTSLFQ